MNKRPQIVTLSLEDIEDSTSYMTLVKYIQGLEAEVKALEDKLAVAQKHREDEELDCW